jgi:5-methylcytosine-specific restriction endonuclease McrA
VGRTLPSCKICGTQLGDPRSKQCSSCRWIGRTHPMLGRDRSGTKGPFYGRRHLQSAIEKIRAMATQRTREKSSNWKGGISLDPKCVDCGRPIPHYKAKRCKRCYIIKLSIRMSGAGSYFYGRGFSRVKSAEERSKISVANSGPNHPNWQGGISFIPYPLGWTRTHKEQIRYRDGYKCQVCGMPEVENDRKLHVHHIDYDKSNIDPMNLISLCTGCHCKTGFRRGFWQKFLTGIIRNIYGYSRTACPVRHSA